MMRILNALIFVVILLFVAACDLYDCDPNDHGGSWMTCMQLSNDPSGKARYTPVTLFLDYATSTVHSLNGGTIPSQAFDCTPFDLKKQGQGQGSQTVYRPKDHTPIESGPRYTPHPATSERQTGVYPAPPLLALPFAPLRAQTQFPVPSSDCAPTSADVLLVNQTNNTVTRLGTCPFAIKTIIPVASRPLEVDLMPDAQTALVTSYDNAVNFIDLTSNKVAFTLTTDSSVNPSGIAITPDGTRAYITSFNSMNPAVLAIDLASRSIVATIPVTTYPQSLFMTPDGSELYVTFPLQDAVYVIDTLSNSLVTTISIPAPYGIDFSPTGTKAYITSASGSPAKVVVLDTTTYTVLKSYPVGASPIAVAVMYGGRFVIVNNVGSNSVSVIDTLTDTVKTSDVGGAPLGISFVQ